MLPDKLKFLSEFENSYNKLVLAVKEDKYNEQEFYLIVAAKVKAMDRERRKKLTRLNEKAKTVQAV